VVTHFELTMFRGGRCPPLFNLSRGQRPRLNEIAVLPNIVEDSLLERMGSVRIWKAFP